MIALLQQVLVTERIPAQPPIGGALWTIVIPAALFVITLGGTIALYLRFAGQEQKKG